MQTDIQDTIKKTVATLNMGHPTFLPFLCAPGPDFCAVPSGSCAVLSTLHIPWTAVHAAKPSAHGLEGGIRTLLSAALSASINCHIHSPLPGAGFGVAYSGPLGRHFGSLRSNSPPKEKRTHGTQWDREKLSNQSFF